VGTSSGVIFKSKVLIESCFDGLPDDGRLEVSPNGWTSDEIGLRWLLKLFIPSTSSRTKGKYRLLVLDGHGSHLTPEFDKLCEENNIIAICMPPHSSHLVQSLDIGCFAVLKCAYGRLIGSKMRARINHVHKLDFLEAYPTARIKAFKSETIENSFAAAGLVPYDPDRVISKLDICLRTPNPPRAGVVIGSLKQASSIKALLKQRSKSPLSPLNCAIK
jgi:hypothetical protein